jgi:type VI secretion system protein
MALRLRIVSEHARRLGTRATKVFGVHGGTIGRATDNDWILPDPERFLSGKHACVEFRAGSFFIVDASSNGTYVNGAHTPLGKSNDRQLKDGDYLRLGEYEMLVSIDESNDFPPDESAIVAYDGGTPSAAVRKSTANDIGAKLDLSELLEPSDELMLPRTPAAKPAAPAPAVPAAQAAAPAVPAHDAYGGQSLLDAEEATPWHMMTRPLKVERTPAAEARLAEPLAMPPGRAKSSSLYDGDIDSGVMELCRGAGLDPETVAPENRAAMLQLCGRLLREVVVGLLDVSQSSNEFKNRFRITPPSNEDGPNFFGRGVDESVRRLLTTTSVRNGSVDAIRESFQELKSQQAAVMVAMHAAFEECLGRLDPQELTERFERAGKRSVFGSQNKNRYWELYAEMYSTLAQRPKDGFPHLFVETFARAFEEKLTSAKAGRRSAFGADRDEWGSTSSSGDTRAVGES